MTKSYTDISKLFPIGPIPNEERKRIMEQQGLTPFLIEKAWFVEQKQKFPELWEQWVSDGLIRDELLNAINT